MGGSIALCEQVIFAKSALLDFTVDFVRRDLEKLIDFRVDGGLEECPGPFDVRRDEVFGTAY